MDSVPPAYLPTIQDGPALPLLSILDIPRIPKPTSSVSPLSLYDIEETDPFRKAKQIMYKMGHGPDRGLGREEQGRRHPIQGEGNIGRSGLGYQMSKPCKTSRKWKLWDHFVRGPTEGATLEQSNQLQSQSSLQPTITTELEEVEEIDYGLTLMLQTPEEGSSSPNSPSASLNQDHFIPINGLRSQQCLMISVFDHKKKRQKCNLGLQYVRGRARTF